MQQTEEPAQYCHNYHKGYRNGTDTRKLQPGYPTGHFATFQQVYHMNYETCHEKVVAEFGIVHEVFPAHAPYGHDQANCTEQELDEITNQ